MNIQYAGEHLLPGLAGKIFVWIGFATAILSVVFYLISVLKRRKPGQREWLRNARLFYLLHALSLIAVTILLYYLIFSHYFEYSYVWQYSSSDLPTRYIFSCFWAGQEGSFLIWGLWQALIGIILVRISRNWESGVMVTFTLSQAFVTSMLLGIDLFGYQVGSSPFTLIRETLPTVEGTIFALPDYLSKLTEGNGLNPLLENFWMTIHPPVLFLGYALTLVPFCYAIASLIKKDFHTWVSRALPWAIMALLMLGAGILLGGAWAYVSLTFGGFWSWDPVENSSLVPWMTLVAALHFLLIARRQNYALLGAYIMILLSYILVLYASFLTRSGVLAETSAHSFGDNGMTLQLLVFLLAFLVLMIIMIGINARKFQKVGKDIFLSREFWMFTGSVIVVLAAFQIIFTTSIPVFNTLFDTDFAPPSDRVGFYNRWQMPYALLIAAFIAFSQFLNYNSNESATFFKKQGIPLGLSLILTIVSLLAGIVSNLNLSFFLFFILFALLSSIANLVFQTARPRNFPAIITHIGFITFLLGTLVTFSNSVIVSTNTSKYDLGDAKANEENLLLMRYDTLYMGDYYVSYINNRKEGNTTTYRIDFLKFEKENFRREFSLYPSVNANPRMGSVYNPDTRHFLLRDYYTYISAVSQEPDYIVIKTIMNPYIGVLWAGALVMIAGFGYAFARRARRNWNMVW